MGGGRRRDPRCLQVDRRDVPKALLIAAGPLDPTGQESWTGWRPEEAWPDRQGGFSRSWRFEAMGSIPRYTVFQTPSGRPTHHDFSPIRSLDRE
jgi:hypothetical protein